MSAAIGFWANASDMNSGLGFFGSAGFSSPVAIGSYQGRSFITDSSGITMGAEANNCQYINPTGVVLGQSGSGILLNQIPNSLASINIRGTFDSAVRTLNTYLYVYDGVAASITGTGAPGATGVTTKVYEISHLSNIQTAIGSGGPGTITVSGQHSWNTFTAATTTSGLALTAAPGISGIRPSGSSTTDTRHDWYVAMSVTPVSAGSRSWGCFVSTDYI